MDLHFCFPLCSWEHHDPEMLSEIFDVAPQCILDSAADEGFTTMHVYLSDYVIACGDDEL